MPGREGDTPGGVVRMRSTFTRALLPISVGGESMTAKTPRRSAKAAGSTSALGQTPQSFTDEERAAMKERARELRAEARASKNRAEGEGDVLAKIAEMPEPDRTLATRLHTVVTTSAPALTPKTWYGMPAYARDGKIVCFFQGASKFGSRYATLGFNDTANLDEGALWPTSFALTEWSADVEATVVALVTKAVG